MRTKVERVIETAELENFCNELLAVDGFDDYCPNGLQLDAGTGPVRGLVSGVTACQALIDAAVEQDADLLLVHHGYFWRGEGLPLTGIKGRRIGSLYRNGVSLLAYHLPLDAHPELGNNRLLGEALGFPACAPIGITGSLLWQAEADLSASELAQRIQQGLDRKPLHLSGGPERIRRLAWCSGGAQGDIVTAAGLGFDAYISGEVSEQTAHLARELGIHYFAAGHHATERFGVQALGEHLAKQFGLDHHFIDISNPV
jgi:dinuclear metal center YbgI/SA1388 family protein